MSTVDLPVMELGDTIGEAFDRLKRNDRSGFVVLDSDFRPLMVTEATLRNAKITSGDNSTISQITAAAFPPSRPKRWFSGLTAAPRTVFASAQDDYAVVKLEGTTATVATSDPKMAADLGHFGERDGSQIVV